MKNGNVYKDLVAKMGKKTVEDRENFLKNFK